MVETPAPAGPVEKLLRRDRQIVLAGLAAVTALAWGYLWLLAREMGGGMASMMALRPWTAADFWFTFAMWAVMMVAMMIPSATPAILLYARVVRRKNLAPGPLAGTTAFLGGYLAVWTGFGAGATGLQWGLERLALLSPQLVAASPWLGGLLLLAAGSYQLHPAKQVCLRRCRTPIDFLASRWQPGAAGALRMGVEHGIYCLGCCWAIMLLLFAGGVMNLLWVAAIAAFVLIEKAAPFGRTAGRAGALLLLGAGFFYLVSALI